MGKIRGWVEKEDKGNLYDCKSDGIIDRDEIR